jgi:hypothetical protein
MSMTPRDFQKVAVSHYMKLHFSLALRDLKLVLNEKTTEENFQLFKKAVVKAKMKEVLVLVERCENENLKELFFKPDDIEEGEEYAFISNGKKMGGTIVKCDCCQKYCYINGYQVDRFPKSVLPAKALEDIQEMAGYSEDRDQSECEECYANDGKIVKPKKAI